MNYNCKCMYRLFPYISSLAPLGLGWDDNSSSAIPSRPIYTLDFYHYSIAIRPLG